MRFEADGYRDSALILLNQKVLFLGLLCSEIGGNLRDVETPIGW